MDVSGVIPQLRTTNLRESIDFYVNGLGFELQFQYEDFYASIRAGQQSFHLKLVDHPDPSISFVASGGHLHLYFPTNDAASAAERCRHQGVTILREIEDTPWGTREFYVSDPQGHVLCFAQAIDQ